jgi:paxillin
MFCIYLILCFQHFVCAHCNQELGTQNFFERDGKSYCEDDYQHLFSPRCDRCDEAILDKCVSALDQTFHPECFSCSDCGADFGDKGFHEKENKALCQVCNNIYLLNNW